MSETGNSKKSEQSISINKDSTKEDQDAFLRSLAERSLSNI